MIIDWGIVIILVLGVLVGLLVGSPTFRKKFFVGLRNFLGWNKSKRGTGRRTITEDPEERDVQRRYVRTVKLIQCPTCKGKKQVRAKGPRIMDPNLAGWVVCPTCEGTGEVEED